MTAFVFRPKRRKKGKGVQWRTYSGRYRRPGETKLTTVALHVTDKAVAEAKLRQLIREIEQEEIGIAVPKRVRLAAQVSLLQHVSAYCDDLAGRQCVLGHVATVRARLTKLVRECGWERLIDVTAESFEAWRAKQTWAPKTLNDYLAAASALFAWLHRAGRVEQNPLRSIHKSETRGKERRKRRAFTPEQLESIVAVAGGYRLAVLTAYYTGLRRNELKQLEWGDVHRSIDEMFIIPRTSTTKNHETKRCYLPSWFAGELIESKPREASTGDRIFRPGWIPSIWAFRTLLKRAGIEYKDKQGRQADFHALRRSLNTHLAQRAVDPQVRQEIMRHKDISLTLDTYTDKPMLPVAAAVEKLPVFVKQLKDAHLDAHNPDVSGHDPSHADNSVRVEDISEAVEDEERRRTLALTDVMEQNVEKSCLARIRT
jgi:integrase